MSEIFLGGFDRNDSADGPSFDRNRLTEIFFFIGENHRILDIKFIRFEEKVFETRQWNSRMREKDGEKERSIRIFVPNCNDVALHENP